MQPENIDIAMIHVKVNNHTLGKTTNLKWWLSKETSSRPQCFWVYLWYNDRRNMQIGKPKDEEQIKLGKYCVMKKICYV